ncbi:interleukin-1 receptor-associated kinase 3 isoform X2 [Dunckerocampus dactyliophorus]|uniref:interleukin-1 receptor-associated kinase 3 isoform X2 n=1 Tax=Dunckerocampus dactyliophorus TaxID=161453 RepID=UPI0024059D67|nr:interleukin-1 receptor-associated kinase 3 isoform X2 [Dunckerocampus dactyliophorus]
MEAQTFLYDVPPLVIEQFCQLMDIGCCRYGWRGLAARICPSFSEVRVFERMEEVGRSPTKELLWSWAQQNSRVQDLLWVLQDMGHHRALQLFLGPFHPVTERPLPLINECVPAADMKESGKLEMSHSQEAFIQRAQQPQITLQNILKGTSDFHHEARISVGTFSDVYRARVGGTTFAVKLFKQVNNTSWKKLWDIFRKEMEVLGLCRHPNILELLGCFSDERRYCLVYPYMPNGSLFRRLHHQDGVPPLSWEERLSIIKGIAKALHHLHESQPCAVICGNLSSSNILLDKDMQPKLSDFSSARLRPHPAGQSHTVTLHTSCHGNLDYLPEEYIRHGKLSCSLDVYSFGMVVMETITGRKVVEEVPKRTQLRSLLVSEVEDSGAGVDACLQFLDTSAGQWPSSVTHSLLDLSLRCTASHQRDRPIMENVLQTLSQLLPPPSCSSLEQPHSLDDGANIHIQHIPSLPVEHDEQCGLPTSPAQTGPCECSQSEVTYLSVAEADHVDASTGDRNKSWPVQCSCQAATGDLCEDCVANSIANTYTQFSG